MKDFPPFRLDTINQCLWRGEQRILLPPKAFAILCYLVDHAGRLVTQAELLDSLWPDTFVQPEVLKSHILDVRAALGDRARNSLFIETLPRRGYRFMAPVRDLTDSPSASPAVSGTRMIGRKDQLAKLLKSLADAGAGNRQIVFVTGEMGVGKTTIVDVFAQHAAAREPGVRILRGQCTESFGTQEAYYPIFEAVGQLLRGPDSEALVPAIAAYAPTFLVQFPALLKAEHREMLQRELQGATAERMLRELCEALENLSAESTLVLVLEDVHWVDASTVGLISALASRRSRCKLMVVATYRPVHVALTGHPILGVKRLLMVQRLCHEVEIEPLSEMEVAAYLTDSSHGAALPAGLVGLVYKQSEGNALFLKAVIDHLSSRGFIANTSDGWTVNVPLSEIDMEVPPTVRELLEMLIDRRLSEEERTALEAASVSGVRFLAESAASAAEMDVERFESLCDRFSQRGQLVRFIQSQELPAGTVTQRYGFVHAMYREVFYQRMTPGRRARLHARIGERLERMFELRPATVAAELAVHFEEAADWQRAVRYLLIVADIETERFAHTEAVRILEHALELVSRMNHLNHAEELRVLEKLGAVYARSDQLTRAVETFKLLAGRAAARGDQTTELRALVQLAFPLARISSRQCVEVADNLLRLSLQQPDARTKALTQIHALFWRITTRGWDNNEVSDCLAIMDGNGEYAAPTIKSTLLWLSSEYQKSLETLDRQSPVAVADNEFAFHGDALILRPFLHLYLGEIGKGLTLFNQSIARAQRDGNHVSEFRLLLIAAHFYLHSMDAGSIIATCESALPLLTGPDRDFLKRNCLVVLGAAEALAGRTESALTHLSEVRDAMEREDVFLGWYQRFVLHQASTELALAQNSPDAAATALKFLDAALATAERTWQALAWEANTRVALAAGDPARSRECIDNAIALTESCEIPLAHWRVHGTAMRVFPEREPHHRKLAAATIHKLAESLSDFPALREIFVSSRIVQSVLTEKTGER